ncbi:UDP-N-acetylmuramate dehydrogenase [Parasediminibacterium paludis]|uniref:UDP-N-acetylenolpyruvoylglucosamine reductase n=1 Tax=Parasediminibacterium paludis TaxID=908966 RepID=A0ABV8PTV5_9BACT
MQLQQNVSLKPYNTFGINVLAKYFASFSNIDELSELLSHHTSQISNHKLILGGGSNILFTQNFDGLVLKNELKGISLINEDADYYYVKAAAGEVWQQFVQHCIANNYAGIENLSLIPGNVGASPMQNIGAYGVEIKDIFHSLEAYHIQDRKIVIFSLNDCQFGYRESVFKRQYKGQFVILSVTYKLHKQPVFNTSYGAINAELEQMGVKELSIQTISQAIINIRSSKLPDPKKIGNAGSFFKNPQISKFRLHVMKEDYEKIPAYPVDDTYFKIAAGWLIEQCGWKGFRKGDAGCNPLQALVLVNYGNATGKEIFDLSTEIIQSVEAKFGITLEREVNIM